MVFRWGTGGLYIYIKHTIKQYSRNYEFLVGCEQEPGVF